MTSSGLGGTNGHVVLESPPPIEEIFNGDRVAGPILLVAGGLSPRSATAIAEEFGNLCVVPEELPVLSYLRLTFATNLMADIFHPFTRRSRNTEAIRKPTLVSSG